MKSPTPKHLKQKDGLNNPDSGLVLLVISIILFAGGLFFVYQPTGSEHATHSSVGSGRNRARLNPQSEELIDQQLKDADLRGKIQSDWTEIENRDANSAEPTDVEEVSRDHEKVNPLIFDQENSGNQVIREIEEKKKKDGNSPATPDQRITKKLERDEWSRDYDQKYQEEYVRQFLENAREKGVDVKLNENLDVTGLRRIPLETPIRVPQSEPAGSK